MSTTDHRSSRPYKARPQAKAQVDADDWGLSFCCLSYKAVKQIIGCVIQFGKENRYPFSRSYTRYPGCAFDGSLEVKRKILDIECQLIVGCHMYTAFKQDKGTFKGKVLDLSCERDL